jgi:predicted component of type VI protein secretion system
MFKAEKVLWGEGLFLRPQHFQLQDTYQEQRLNHTIRSTIPYPYGIKNTFDPNFCSFNYVNEIIETSQKSCLINTY